jgi:formylglycine-generating enzyme required for sulfatase activity
MIYDMTGNVSEWCNDWYGVEYYVNGHGNNPQGAEMGTQKVMRGGSYRYWDWERDEACKIYSRSFSLPERCIYYCGFRIVRDSR